jgi:hypothetical protein
MSTVAAPQQTNWKFILITAGGALVLGFVFLKGFFLPFQDNVKKVAAAEEAYDREYQDYRVFQQEKGRLERDRLLGMPRDTNQASNDYIHYLQKLLEKAGFDKNPDVGFGGVTAPSTSTSAGKKAGHGSVTFNAKARGTWINVVKFLDMFQRTAFMHRLRNWSVDAPTASKEPGKLTLNMTIEALVVNKNERRPENLWGVDPRAVAADAFLGMNRLPTGWATLLRAQALLLPQVPPKREYGELVRVNPFVGGPIKVEKLVDLDALAKKKEEDQKKKDKDARANATLVQTDTDGQKALLIAPTSPDKSTPIKLARNSTFPLWDGLKGKVLRVDHRDVYFEVDSKLYGIHIGTTLADAYKQPLSAIQGKKLNLPGGKGL